MCSSDLSVSITESSVRVTDEYTGEGNFFLGEITPSMDVAELKNSPYKVKLVNSLFHKSNNGRASNC